MSLTFATGGINCNSPRFRKGPGRGFCGRWEASHVQYEL